MPVGSPAGSVYELFNVEHLVFALRIEAPAEHDFPLSNSDAPTIRLVIE